MQATSVLKVTLVALVLQVAQCYDSAPAPEAAVEEICGGQDLATCSQDKARAAFTADDFVLNFDKPSVNNAGGTLRGEFVNSNPALVTLPENGIGQNLITLTPCAINQPAVHPRGTEVAFVTKGTVFFGFIEENPGKDYEWGGRFLSKNLTAGQSFVIPQGLIHFAQNLECEEAQFLATFPTRDPGTVTVFQSLFLTGVPDSVYRATLGLVDETIQMLRKEIDNNPNPSLDLKCLERCGLDQPEAMGEDEYLKTVVGR